MTRASEISERRGEVNLVGESSEPPRRAAAARVDQHAGERTVEHAGAAGARAVLVVAAPLAGTAVDLAAVPDPVFAAAMVGPGAAVDPDRSPGTVVAPVAGTLVKLKPHAFVVADGHGRGVLVHLGIDTVTLGGDGFTLLAAEGDRVEAGTPVVAWDPAAVEASGRSPVCPVVALDAAPETIDAVTHGPIGAGQPLFRWG